MNFEYLKKIYKIITNQKISIFFLIILTLAASSIELIGIGIIYSFVELILNPNDFNNNIIFNYLNFDNNNRTINYLAILILIVFLFRAFIAIFLNKTILTICFTYGANLRKKLISIYLNKTYETFKEKNNSEYLYHINTLSIQFSQQILLSIVRLFSELFIISIITIYLIYNFGLEFFIIASITIIFLFLYDKIFKKKITEYGKKINIISNKLIQIITESLNGYKELDILNKKKLIFNRVNTLTNDYSIYNVRQKVITHAPRYLLDFVIIFAVFVMIFILQLIYNQKLIEYIPLISVFAFAAIRFIPSSNIIIRGISNIRFGKNTVERLYNDLKLSYNIEQSIIEIDDTFINLKLKNISFTFSNSIILKNLNLEINKNDFVGIMGESGSGKTTLIDIILGFYKIQNGEFIINDKKFENPYDFMKNKVAYIPQSNFLMDQSIKLNICLEENITIEKEKKIEEIINKLNMKEVIFNLPDNLNTKIGDKDHFMSGGQIQRIAIARALYHERDILIFDESTNSLDEENEKNILNLLKQLSKEKTIIIISHRKNSFIYCNKIFLLKNQKLHNIN